MVAFSIGCDPEIFLTKEGEGMSAHGVIPGNKKEPHKVEEGMVQVDGMAVEFGIDPVDLDDFRGPSIFNKRVVSVMAKMKDMVQETEPKARFNINSVQEFKPEVMDAQPDEAKELGCDPDYNAYTLEVNPRPDAAAVNFRTASGHIHIGWGSDIPVEHPDHMKICGDFVKMMDAIVGLYMTILDDDARRRTLYGKAGAFRPKPYGVEYRTPSNLWLTNKSRREDIFALTKLAVGAMQRKLTVDRLTGCKEEDIQKIINDGDYEKAYSILRVGVCRNLYVQYEPVYKHIMSEYKARRVREGVDPAPVKKPKTMKVADIATTSVTFGLDDNNTTASTANPMWITMEKSREMVNPAAEMLMAEDIAAMFRGDNNG